MFLKQKACELHNIVFLGLAILWTETWFYI